jgi:excisionase family DNA binding protein
LSLNLEGWLTVSQAAELTGYSKYHIRYLLRESTIQGQKVGQAWLVNREDLLRYKTEMDSLGTEKFSRTRSSDEADTP